MKNNLIYIGVGVFVLLLIFSVLATSGFFNRNESSGIYTSYKSNTPEECKPPYGQDVDSWVEHLGHHSETKYCLEYYK